MTGVRTKIGPGGRIVIPAEYRRELNWKPGDEVIMEMKDGEVRVTTVLASLRRAQEIVRRFIPPNVSLVDEFLREKREEVEREEEEERR